MLDHAKIIAFYPDSIKGQEELLEQSDCEEAEIRESVDSSNSFACLADSDQEPWSVWRKKITEGNVTKSTFKVKIRIGSISSNVI